MVSFGLFVPSRILNSAKYGGLNVHPSFLPEYVYGTTRTALMLKLLIVYEALRPFITPSCAVTRTLASLCRP